MVELCLTIHKCGEIAMKAILWLHILNKMNEAQPSPKQKKMMETKKFIITGGGTGGHIYPAIAIADEIKKRYPESEILFVGANGRMEMRKVPEAGYKIIGLDVAGLERRNILKNILVMYRFWKAIRKAKNIIRDFAPNAVIGVGGYASAPLLSKAHSLKVPSLIQEQNSYAGITNKLLGKKASVICVAYDHMENYFPKSKLVKTGNPCRESLLNVKETKEEAREFFGLDPNKKTLLIVGGSLGARTINMSTYDGIDKCLEAGIQVIWQCGTSYLFDLSVEVSHKLGKNINSVKMMDFITRMDLAYHAADLVVSRAGASSISELSLLHKPCILIPSPNVAEDHQTKNAKALSSQNAALLISDKDALRELISTCIKTINSKKTLEGLSKNIAHFAEKNSAKRIVDELDKLIEKEK